MTIQTKTFSVEKINSVIEDVVIESDANYVICRADPNDSVYESRLYDSGFRFLDRVLFYEIDVRTFNDLRVDKIPGVEFACDYEIGDNVYALAHEAFNFDRRFFLAPSFDQGTANYVIDAYLDNFKNRKLKIYKAIHDRELLGFTVVDEDVKEYKNCFENVLGATKPGIKGKMIAGSLYSTMIAGEKDRFKKYIGRVSSLNLSSINLHSKLGGRVTEVYDELVINHKKTEV